MSVCEIKGSAGFRKKREEKKWAAKGTPRGSREVRSQKRGAAFGPGDVATQCSIRKRLFHWMDPRARSAVPSVRVLCCGYMVEGAVVVEGGLV